VGFGLVGYGLWAGLEAVDGNGRPDVEIGRAFAEWPIAWALVGVGCRAAGAVVTVPLAEELAFRGYVVRRLSGCQLRTDAPPVFRWSALLASAVLFGILHGRWFAGSIVGGVYALALYRRGKLSDAVLAHATTNLLVVVRCILESAG
jgi:CAAX prenyl protease-like protein